MTQLSAELIPAMDINEILLHLVNPENLKKEISSEDLGKAKDVLAERFNANFKAAQFLRRDIANSRGNIKSFTSRKIKNQLDHLRCLIRTRSNPVVDVQQDYYRRYWDFEDKKHTPEIPYDKIKDPELIKWIDLSLLTDAYHQYFDLGVRQKKNKWIPDFNTTIAKQLTPKNQFLVHNKPASIKAHFYAFFIRQKHKERIIRKIYKRIMIEEFLAELEKRDFNEENCYLNDHIGLRVIGGYFFDTQKKKFSINKTPLDTLFSPPGKPTGFWQHDRKKHSKSRLDCVKYSLINSSFPFSTISLQYTDLISVISEEFAQQMTDLIRYNRNINPTLDSSVLSHKIYEREWYKIWDENKIKQIGDASGTMQDIRNLEGMIEKKEKYFNQINERLSIVLPGI